MQKYLHLQENRRILERSAAVDLMNSIKEKTMKLIRVALLVMALAFPVFADDIPNGIAAAGDIPNNVTAADEIPNGVTLLNLLLILL